MPPLKDLTNKIFGELTVLNRAPSKNKKTYWNCLCQCGREIEIRGDALVSGKTKSCGYCGEHPSKLLDITGERFGKLTVIGKIDKKDNQGRTLWKCVCDCGAIIEARGTHLRYGSTLSCGSAECRGVKKNIVGERFGKLVVVEESDYKSPHHNNVYWKCRCDCGGTTVVNGSYLRCGITTSCGCVSSKGEMKVNQLLTSFNIPFSTQKIFDSCRFPDTNAAARFDFYVNNKYLIEFDGIQHFECKESGWDTEEKFQKTTQRDQYKNQWCKENNIPLIRIPYTKLDTLCIEDLMLETTQFRVV